MSFYSVLAVTPTSDEWSEDYIVSTPPILARHGGKYLARTTNHECIEGANLDDKGQEVSMRIIIEWPSKEAALAFMSDPDYIPHLKVRSAGSISQHFLIDGKDELA